MAWPEIEAQYKQILGAAAAVLKDAGYKRSGPTFRHFSGECCAIVNFQRSRGNSDDEVRFTVNLSVISARLFELQKLWETDTLASATEAHGHLRTRIGILMKPPQEKWWRITQFTLAEPIVSELVPLLHQDAVPYLRRYLTDQALIELWESGKAPGLTIHQRDRNLSGLKAAIA